MKKWIMGALLALLAVTLLACASDVKVEETSQSEKNIVTISSSTPLLSFEEVCDKSINIVYGKVLSKGEATVIQYEGIAASDCYRDVTIEVMESVKGELQPGDELTYREWGGETAEKIYIYSSSEIVEIGDHVLIFQSPKLGALTDLYFWIVDEETEEISILASIVQDTAIAGVMQADSNQTMVYTTVSDVLQAAQDYLSTEN